MNDQAEHWSRAAATYEREFIDPYGREGRNPLFSALDEVAEQHSKTVADLGCGIGPSTASLCLTAGTWMPP